MTNPVGHATILMSPWVVLLLSHSQRRPVVSQPRAALWYLEDYVYTIGICAIIGILFLVLLMETRG